MEINTHVYYLLQQNTSIAQNTSLKLLEYFDLFKYAVNIGNKHKIN